MQEMKFPRGNKFNNTNAAPDLNADFGGNAELLEEAVKKIDWKYWVKIYCAGIGLLAATLFVIIVAIRAALAIF